MAYGRLDVFWPDGKFRAFPLKETKVSVGRSPGNTITLETETISRYHLSITHEEGEVRLADMESQNGTYVDGVKLASGETIVLRGGEEIMIGHLRIIYHEMDEMPTQPIRGDDSVTQRIEKEDLPFVISVQPPPIAVPPGAHASAELTIINTTDEKHFYIVEVKGVPREWVRMDRPKVFLHEKESSQVVINFKPVRRPDTAPGEYPITISVRDENQPELKQEVTTRVRILPYGGFGAALERKEIDSRERFRLHIHNQGSANLPLIINGSERLPNVDVSMVSSSHVTLAPGQRLVIQGTVKPQQTNYIGKPRVYPYDLVIHSQDPSQFVMAVRGRVVQEAILPSWLPYVAGLVLLVFVVLAALIISFMTAPEPSIDSMVVNSTRVPRGEPLTISWDVHDVNNLTLYIDETPAFTLDPATGSTTLDTSNLPSSALVSLIGSTRNRQDRKDQIIQVYEPIQIVSFNANPSRLVLNVVQSLDLTWEIANAEFVQIGGLETFTTDTTAVGTRFEPVDAIENLVGIPEQALSIEVYAEDSLGNPFTQRFVIDAIPAQCAPISGTVTLRDGPTEFNRQVGTVPEDATVTVDARDVTGLWVRVQLDAGLVGWGALDRFDCAGTFEPGNLRQVLDVTPPPIPSATPAIPSPTPAPRTETPVATTESQTIGPGAIVTPTQIIVPSPQPTTAG